MIKKTKKALPKNKSLSFVGFLAKSNFKLDRLLLVFSTTFQMSIIFRFFLKGKLLFGIFLVTLPELGLSASSA